MIDQLKLSDLIAPQGAGTNPITFTAGLNVASEVFSQRAPYVLINKLGGNEYIFSPVFISLLIEAFSTDCLSKMSEEELNLLDQLTYYEDTGITSNLATIALDQVLVGLTQNIPIPSVDTCNQDITLVNVTE